MKSVRIAKVFRALIYSLSVFLFVSFSQTETINIPEDYLTIQEGIEVAEDYDTVLVADGIYTENINFLGRAILVVSESGAETTIIEKLYDGQPVVYFQNNENNSSIFKGFTIRNATTSGIICSYAYPTIRECIIENNTSSSGIRGGGLSIYDNSTPAIIRNNIFRNNSGGYGGAILINDGNASIDSNVIYDNYSYEDCAAVEGIGGTMSLRYNVMYNNGAYDEGGAIEMVALQNCEVFNNTIIGNECGRFGGGIFISGCSNIQLKNNIIANNDLYGIYVRYSSGITQSYSCFYDNSSGGCYGISPGTGTIDEDPLFVDPLNNNYHLTAGSPCIDTGDPSSPSDPDGSRADMGALFYGTVTNEYALDIAEALGEQGQPVEVPMFAYGLEAQEIAGVELHIGYDASCLDFLEISSEYLTDALVNEEEGQVHILWD